MHSLGKGERQGSMHKKIPWNLKGTITQRAKKVVSDSPGLVDFAIGLVNSVFNLPDGQVIFLKNSKNRRTVRSIILLFKKLLG